MRSQICDSLNASQPRYKNGDQSELIIYFISRAEEFECCHLVGCEGFAEEVNGGHLTTEHGVRIHVVTAAKITLVERLQHTFIRPARFNYNSYSIDEELL